MTCEKKLICNRVRGMEKLEKLYTVLSSGRLALFAPVYQSWGGRKARHCAQKMEKRRPPLAALETLVWRMWGPGPWERTWWPRPKW